MFCIHLFDRFFLLLLCHILLLLLLLILFILTPDPLIRIFHFKLLITPINLLTFIFSSLFRLTLFLILLCCFCTDHHLSFIIKLHMNLKLLEHILVLLAVEVVIQLAISSEFLLAWLTFVFIHELFFG